MKRKINKIIIHHSASKRLNTTVGLVKHWHLQRGWPHIGYHRLIQMDGKIANTLSLDKEGFGVYGKNKEVIHICVLGNFIDESPTKKQLASLECECLKLCKRFNLRPWDISYHKLEALRDRSSECPGKYLIDEIRPMIDRIANQIIVRETLEVPKKPITIQAQPSWKDDLRTWLLKIIEKMLRR